MISARPWLALVAWLGACAEPSRLDVRLQHPRGLVPADALESLTAEIVAVEGGRVISRRTVAASELDGPVVLFDDAELVRGERYELRLRAPAPRVCRLGRAGGRSRPFVHGDETQPVPVMLGCADELAAAPGAPVLARMAHSVAVNGRGELVVVGGAARASSSEDGIGWTDLRAPTETWDPLLARFVPGATLREPRVLAGVLALTDGSIAVAGGFVESAPISCTSSVERLVGLTSSPAGPLSYPRCGPATALLPAVPGALVAGGAFLDPLDRSTDAELWDASMRVQLGGDLRATSFRGIGRAVPLSDGASALVVGGNAPSAPVAELFRVPGGCDDTTCFAPVAGGPDASSTWASASATWVPCATGGGAVYVVGGQLEPPEQPARAVAEAWCFLDAPGVSPALVTAGALPAPRTNHLAEAVDGPGGAWRLLIVGGTASDGLRETLPYTDALLVPVDGCTCSALDPGQATSLPVPLAGYALLGAMARLPDGSVLAVGGARFAAGSAGPALEATGEAALFVPDVGP